jgi:integrase
LVVTRNAAAWLLARYTGMRCEELAEANLDNIVTTPGAAGDVAPVLDIPRSKTDHPHEVVLQPAAMEVLDMLVDTMRKRYGRYPRATRFDAYEHVDQPPSRLLFVSVAASDIHGPDLTTIRTWRRGVRRWQELDLDRRIPFPIWPQMMRRLRASELNRANVNVFAVMSNLGHRNIATTEVYTYPDTDKTAADFLQALEKHG